MEKQTFLFCAMMVAVVTSCGWHHRGNTDISYSKLSHYYSMKAYFNRNKTRTVENYMDKKIGDRSNMSFRNTRIDGQIALDDHTTFYIKKYPGFLEIKFDKEENSVESYQRVRTMCEGIKGVVTE
jgi:outer membrane lipopolysaccharide assembly protein LptE/RlpB